MTTEIDFDFETGDMVEIAQEKAKKPAKCTINKEKNGIELRFKDKPSYSILGELKDAKWSWHRTGKFWYKRDTPEARQLASKLADLPE